MKQLIYIILLTLFMDLAFHRCANPGRPTGGPKDTIPPSLIYATPINGTTNFNGSEIELSFSEYINVDKLKQQLIITPNTDINYKSIVKRNRLIIKLDGELQDSTTYNFNFANGVTDITEKNPAINLSLAFSTGPFIDSMSVKGTVEKLLTKEPGKGYVVALYPYTDTLDYFADKPMYFTTANDSGNYTLNYLKKGKYKIISFDDDNGNYTLDPETEPHGFLEETIHLDSALSLNPIRCILQNVKPLKLINARPVGKYVEIKFNKAVDSYSIKPSIPNHVVGENKDIIRLYKNSMYNYNDSITSYITAKDSLGNTVIDTINYVFLESNRKPSDFNTNIQGSQIPYIDNPVLNIQFNKPVSIFDTTKAYIRLDSTLQIQPALTYSWNESKTRLSLKLITKTSVLDSLIAIRITKDSASTDTLNRLNTRRTTPELALHFDKSSFISVENDSSTNKSIAIKKLPPKPSGVFKASLVTELTHFRFQLLNNDKVAYELTNQKTFTLSDIKPATYKIRVLIDTNKDGKWSYGNLVKNEEPEEVFIYPEEISIRENWVVELSISI